MSDADDLLREALVLLGTGFEYEDNSEYGDPYYFCAHCDNSFEVDENLEHEPDCKFKIFHDAAVVYLKKPKD